MRIYYVAQTKKDVNENSFARPSAIHDLPKEQFYFDDKANHCKDKLEHVTYNNEMNIRRYYSPGQVVFITQIVKDRRLLFNDTSMVVLLRKIIFAVKEHHRFMMHAYVFLPDHFHLLIRPEGESNFSQIMHSIKRNFTNAYKRKMKIEDAFSVWQHRFWDHVIRSEADFEAHFHYIHYNPVKHGYVNELSAWEFSSYLEWQKRGVYENWKGWQEPVDAIWGE